MLTRKEPTVAKLADFGFAKAEQSAMQTACGTAEYVAPEILMAGAASSKEKNYGHHCDVWSMGVVLYVMLTSQQPFVDERAGHSSDHHTFKKIKSGNFPRSFRTPKYPDKPNGCASPPCCRSAAICLVGCCARVARPFDGWLRSSLGAPRPSLQSRSSPPPRPPPPCLSLSLHLQ